MNGIIEVLEIFLSLSRLTFLSQVGYIINCMVLRGWKKTSTKMINAPESNARYCFTCLDTIEWSRICCYFLLWLFLSSKFLLCFCFVFLSTFVSPFYLLPYLPCCSSLYDLMSFSLVGGRLVERNSNHSTANPTNIKLLLCRTL